MSDVNACNKRKGGAQKQREKVKILLKKSSENCSKINNYFLPGKTIFNIEYLLITEINK